jgi:Leucine-rich repeat (LRR) protein
MKKPNLRKFKWFYNMCVIILTTIFMLNVVFTMMHKEEYRAKSVPGDESNAIEFATEDNNPDENNNDWKPVRFKDANFERIVRFYLRVPETDKVMIRNVSKVTYLNINHSNIRSLEGVENFRSLKGIDLSFNQVTDLTPLTKLKHLEELILYTNKVTDVFELGKIRTLKRLDLSSNNITDIAPIAALTNLEELDLNNNKITVIDSVTKLPKLKLLDVSRNNIKNLNILHTNKYKLVLDWGNKN